MANAEASTGSGYMYGSKPDPRTVAGHGRRTAEENCQYMLPYLLQKAQESPHLTLLDAGCGPGSITVGLAKRMPQGKVTGADFNPDVLLKARQLADESGVNNISFQNADLFNLPFEDGTFDVVHTHQTITHCKDSVRAIKELIRVTRKGGIVCMREADMHSVRFWPDAPLLDEAFGCIAKSADHTKNAWSDAGRRLKAWTAEAGISRERIIYTAGAWCYNTPEQRQAFDGKRILRGATGDKAVELGITTRERIEQYDAAWEEWANHEDGVMMMMHGQVVATV